MWYFTHKDPKKWKEDEIIVLIISQVFNYSKFNPSVKTCNKMSASSFSSSFLLSY